MTDEQINIAIAEACGLFKIEPLRRTTRKGKKDHNGVVLWYCEEHHGGSATYARVPDYLNDLNAMHEAEHRLCKLEFGWRTYADALEDVVGVSGWWAIMGEADKRLVLHSTARQRAEAFLRTIGKWEEVQP